MSLKVVVGSRSRSRSKEAMEILEKNGYIKLLSDEDMDNFKYTPKKETTYGNTQNIVSYELKVKIPNSDSYYISLGSIRSEYMSK
ncbi:MAG: hypothetical protein KH045_12615 [Megamonas funiformis]|uniref:hypothetical protein n=1 Tax=Megamonas funiformis TaxID=437897 RepID=UPI001EC57668|nr:hypothetical protein [Megamonas funiformis]MBS7213356.1 hypothetical protein [Megamonas funiformis]